jgi:hypothetical protein
MPQVGYTNGATLTAVFDPNKLDGSTITAGTVTVNGSFVTLVLSASEVDNIKDARFVINAGSLAIARGKVTYQYKPYQPEEDQIISDLGLAPVAKTGSYSDLTGKPSIPTVPADIGLGNVNNTSDVNKPVSTAQQTALDTKTPNDPVLNNFVYDSTTGSLLSYQENGITIAFTYNSDGTVATSKHGTNPTKTYTYTNGNLSGVS